MSRNDLPLIVIVGPTASGKTSLAIKLAKQFGGEIICADSRTIYRGMDIGTAKPTLDEQSSVQHWGLDLVNPGERFTVADFKQYADQKIAEVRSRGHIPFLVGGTGLYINAVVYDFNLGGQFDPIERSKLGLLSIEELQKCCKENNVTMPENKKNKRYLIRAIERKSISIKSSRSRLQNTIVVGITTPKNILRTNIILRAEQMLASDVVKEAIVLGEKYGWDNEAMTGNTYPLIKKSLDKKVSSSDLKTQFVLSDWHLAKRQMTWLRRNPDIVWADLRTAEQYLKGCLSGVEYL